MFSSDAIGWMVFGIILYRIIKSSTMYDHFVTLINFYLPHLYLTPSWTVKEKLFQITILAILHSIYLEIISRNLPVRMWYFKLTAILKVLSQNSHFISFLPSWINLSWTSISGLFSKFLLQVWHLSIVEVSPTLWKREQKFIH